MKDGDGLVAPALSEKIARDLPLDVVPTNHAKHVREALLGELRVGGKGRDHQDAGVRINFRCRDGGARALVAEYRRDRNVDQLSSRRDSLLAVAIVVDRDQLDSLSENTTFGVEFGNCRSGGFLCFTPPTKRRDRSRRRRGRFAPRRGVVQQSTAQCTEDRAAST
jgi:hypothetical protein